MSSQPQSHDIPNTWTKEEEAEYQRYLDDLDAEYEENVRLSYEARGQANLY